MSRAGSNATAERPQRRTTPPTRAHYALLRPATRERRRNKSELKLPSIFSRTLRVSRPRRGISAIRNVRSTSICDVQSSATNFRFGEGFRAPAFATVGRAPGPALESLPRRKPRGGWGTVWRARLWGFEDRGRLASEASAIGDARCFQRKRRWLGFSMVAMRGSETFASVEGGLATSRGRRARVPARPEAKAIDVARRGAW